MTRTELLPRMASFSFSADEFSLPVNKFFVTLNRVTGNGQQFCRNYHDNRQFVRVYEKELPDNVFIQDFFDIEETSSYRATFTAEFDTVGKRVNRSIHVNFYTPGDGKIQLRATFFTWPILGGRSVNSVLFSCKPENMCTSWQNEYLIS